MMSARTRPLEHAAILSIAASSKFPSDHTIAEYAKEIWNATPCSTEYYN
jgi:glucan phosphorylase